MKRREFLQLTALSTSGLLLLGENGWAAKAMGDDKNPKHLVVVFLRGAVDGLNVVVPYSEASYYSMRPTIAIPRPSENGGALRLDEHFGLHPALSSLMPSWEKGTLAFVHAAGSPDSSRSHFDAQDYMETATPGLKTTPDGWLNRLIDVLPAREAQRKRSAWVQPCRVFFQAGRQRPIWLSATRRPDRRPSTGRRSKKPSIGFTRVMMR